MESASAPYPSLSPATSLISSRGSPPTRKLLVLFFLLAWHGDTEATQLLHVEQRSSIASLSCYLVWDLFSSSNQRSRLSLNTTKQILKVCRNSTKEHLTLLSISWLAPHLLLPIFTSVSLLFSECYADSLTIFFTDLLSIS